MADASVGVLVASQMLEHLKKPVLPPGGALVVAAPDRASAHNRLLLALGRQPTAIRAASPHLRGFVWPELVALLERFGFQVLRSRGAGFYPFSGRPAAALRCRSAASPRCSAPR